MKNLSFSSARLFVRRVFISGVYGIVFGLLLCAISQAQTADTTPPELVEFSITPGEVDLSNNSLVVVTVRIRDAQSGISSIWIDFRAPSDVDTSTGISLSDANRISGDANDGIYRGIFGFRYRAEKGKHKLSVSAFDNNSNYRSFYSEQLAERGFPSEINVGITEAAGILNFSGQILDAKGRGVPNAVVVIYSADYRQLSAVTNPFGFYRFKRISAPRPYVFEIKRKNFKPFAKQLYLDAARSDWNFTLEK